MEKKLTGVVLVLLGFVAWNLAEAALIKAALIFIAVFAILRWTGRMVQGAIVSGIVLALVGGSMLVDRPDEVPTEVVAAQTIPACTGWCKVAIGILSGVGWDLAKVAWEHMSCSNYTFQNGHYQNTHWHGCFEKNQ